jgi:hypothetical protein
MALWVSARAVITVKIVVPMLGSFEWISIISQFLCVSGINTGNDVGKFPVFFGDDIPGIVGTQANFDTVPDIAPVGVVEHFFSMEGDFRHESECVDKVPEGKGSDELVIGFGPHQ